MAEHNGGGNPSARQTAAEASHDYWSWDRVRWGTHRVNCYPGSCPFRVYAKDGRVIREEIACNIPQIIDPEYRAPDYNPRGCQKGYQHSRAMYGAERLLYPMKRKGERGSGSWERITWDQAFDEIGAKLADIIQSHGPQSIIIDQGTNGAGVLRGGGEGAGAGLATQLGGVSLDLNFSIGDFLPGQYLTFGQFQQCPGVENWFLADTVLVYGNPVYACISDYHYVLEARYRGSKVVQISPDKSPSAQFADMWLPVNWSSDPALWLGLCRILIDKGWIDFEFIKEQTDLPVLVRKDDGRFLREADLKEGGDAEQFYVIDAATGKLEALAKGTLQMECDRVLEGTVEVRLKDGTRVEAVTVFTLLRKRVAEYTPERVYEIAGVHRDQLEKLAEWCRPPRRIFFFSAAFPGKMYHGDLCERGACYVLALTGNVGKAGTGSHGWSAGAEFNAGSGFVGSMPPEILESDDPIGGALNTTQKLQEAYKTMFAMDPTMPVLEAAQGMLREGMKTTGTLSPPALFWYYHAGYKDVWDKHLEDPNAPRKISAYVEEAVANGWLQGYDMLAKEGANPKAMFVSGGNPLRRTRGGMNTYVRTVWPKLDLIVVMDPRWSTTALHADYALPAASFYEYADTKFSCPNTRFSNFTDESVPMRGESKSDRQIIHGILRATTAELKKRGIKSYTAGPREIDVDKIMWRATYGNKYGDSNADEERLVDDAYRALGEVGWFTSLDGEKLDLANLRKNGGSWLSGRPTFPAMVAQNADMVAGEVFWCFRDQVEQKVPYVTTTRRIEFYLDHPWFIEADEHLVRYKQPPYIGGHQPMRLTSGHLRWSIHSNWVTAEEMLKLHRGEPFAFINSAVASGRGIADHDYIRVFNDYGDFVVRAKLTECVRPDQLVIYHAWEPYQYPNWMPYDGILPGPVKGLHFAGGYRHYQYMLWNWSPAQEDRHTSIDIEKAAFQG
jgi:DMSO reductase family type II enzyme molybdopterin subunit